MIVAWAKSRILFQNLRQCYRVALIKWNGCINTSNSKQIKNKNKNKKYIIKYIWAILVIDTYVMCSNIILRSSCEFHKGYCENHNCIRRAIMEFCDCVRQTISEQLISRHCFPILKHVGMKRVKGHTDKVKISSDVPIHNWNSLLIRNFHI